ncbi:hypothetical protein SAMN05518672_10356 [Chitinophaga sp. CF118]|uniref:phosphoribosylpyrophosphate synthetase n=1 Tax=Chitinophaga sp. CF118 TaxID=1884367 RepID=UPI0008EECDA3|nr:phosphoribosylpyrophosphate synthetase [Chitinophaga sp. CF118]SFD75004.1 hypothetical protein SAMN05518672_10356 [Chitinophaga sp. CF118]
MEQPAFDTVTESINWLMALGYEHDFNLDNDCLCYENGKKKLTPEQFQIDKVFRFEGMTDPGDENIVYAISSNDHTIKGILVSAFGMYSDSVSDEMVRKLSIIV